VNGVEFTILYTLQHRLARDPEELSGFLHGHIALWGLLDKAIAQFLGDLNLPRCARCHLLAGNKAVV